MESVNNSNVGEPFDFNLPDSCNEFNTFVIPSKEVAELAGLIYSPIENFLVSFAIPAVAIFGILSNMTFIFVLIRVKSMHTLVNIYLANLAIADVCALANILGRHGISFWSSQINLSLIEPFTKSWKCIVFNWEFYTCVNGSMLFVTLITIERYIAICKPMYHRMINTKRRCFKLVADTLVSYGCHKCFDLN